MALASALTCSVAAEPAVVAEAVARFNRHARYPLPHLDDGDLARLTAGKVVKIREVPPDGPQRAVGLVVTAHRRPHLFLAASDPHTAAVDELLEVEVGTHEGYPFRWYQRLDLPFPFADRHWVVDVRDNLAMSEATAGACWEHWWTLAEGGPELAASALAAGRVPGLGAEATRDAVYVTVNEGAWLYVDLPDGRTLLGFNARSVIGGRIPDRLVADYTMLTLGKVLGGVVARVPDATAHYDPAHAPILGGDGRPIAPHGG